MDEGESEWPYRHKQFVHGISASVKTLERNHQMLYQTIKMPLAQAFVTQMQVMVADDEIESVVWSGATVGNILQKKGSQRAHSVRQCLHLERKRLFGKPEQVENIEHSRPPGASLGLQACRSESSLSDRLWVCNFEGDA